MTAIAAAARRSESRLQKSETRRLPRRAFNPTGNPVSKEHPMSIVAGLLSTYNPLRPRRLRCDFCSSYQVRLIYPAPDFLFAVVKEHAFISIGDWASCEDCRQLIEAQDARGLLARIAECSVFARRRARSNSVFCFQSFKCSSATLNRQRDFLTEGGL